MKRIFFRIKNYWKYELRQEIRIYAGFPQIWLFMFVIFLALLSFAGSYYVKNAYWASICANVFAGFVTGIVLFLLTGVRQIYIAKQEVKLYWLKTIHEQIMKFMEKERQLLTGKFGELSLEDYVYDTICEAHNVNVMIRREDKEKRLGFNGMKYCKKNYEYDAEQKSQRDDEVRNKIMMGEYTNQKNVALLFSDIRHDMLVLNHDILADIKDIEIKLKTINRSII